MGRTKTACEYCGKVHAAGSPFWNAGKSTWSVHVMVDGKRRNRVMVKGWEGHDVAMRAFASGKTPGKISRESQSTAAGWEMSVEELCDRYLSHFAARPRARASRTEDVRRLLEKFSDAFGKMTVGDFRKGGTAKIKQWAQSHPTWGHGGLAEAYKWIKAAFAWAAESDSNDDAVDLIPYNPIKKLNTGKNRVGTSARDAILDPKQELVLMNNIDSRGHAFRLAIQALLGTGMRPEEFCSLTAGDARNDQHGNLFLLVNHKNQHKRRWAGKRRPVRLIGDMQSLFSEQIARHPDGPLFRNFWGVAWTKGSLLSALRRITTKEQCVKAGLNAHEESCGKRQFKVVIYTMRHTFGHRCLTGYYKKNGRPVYMTYAQVADLMGNSAVEVERTYGKITIGAPDLVSDLSA